MPREWHTHRVRHRQGTDRSPFRPGSGPVSVIDPDAFEAGVAQQVDFYSGIAANRQDAQSLAEVRPGLEQRRPEFAHRVFGISFFVREEVVTRVIVEPVSNDEVGEIAGKNGTLSDSPDGYRADRKFARRLP
jgi:hypothetical protein